MCRSKEITFAATSNIAAAVTTKSDSFSKLGELDIVFSKRWSLRKTLKILHVT